MRLAALLRLRLAPLLVALTTAGCAQVLGVDDYVAGPTQDAGKDPEGDGASAEPSLPDAGDLFKPKPAFLSLEDCRECSATRCTAEQAACEADELCKGFGEEAFSDPVSDYRARFLPPGSDQDWARDRGESQVDLSAPIANYATCLHQWCAEPCEYGREFSCVGAFDWPTTEPGEKELRYLFFDEAMTPTEWDVRLCMGLTCEGQEFLPLREQSDELGFTRLTFDPGRLASEPNGFVLVEDPLSNHYPAAFALGPAPIETGYYQAYWIFTKPIIDEPYIAAGGKLLQGAGVAGIWAFVRDCSGLPARHVTVEVLTANEVGRGYGPCPDCDATLYTNDEGPYGVPAPGRTEITSITARAIIGTVPTRHALVVARDTLTRRAIAVHHLVPRAETIHYIRMYPASRLQLEQLPYAQR